MAGILELAPWGGGAGDGVGLGNLHYYPRDCLEITARSEIFINVRE